MTEDIGFTGTREGMTDKQKRVFLQILTQFNDYSVFHHGLCLGADTEAHQLIRKHTNMAIYGHPGNNRSMQSLYLYSDCDYLSPATGNIERNHAIIHRTDVLIACPFTKEEIIRSGTWATIRYARKSHREIIIIEP